jgi:outer membrane protein OmpA-like peptidoglycan-associated protein
MVTLLLTFFVMLLSLATTQDPELFNTGRDSFVKSLKGLGLGMLVGKDQAINFTNPKTKYPIQNPENTRNKRTIDAKEERTRRLFNQLRNSAKTMPSQIPGQRYDFSVTGLHFAAGSIELDTAAKQSLSDLCKKLHRDLEPRPKQLYVLGLSDEGSDDKRRWTLSALRAKNVADFVAEIFPEQDRPAVYSWGAGPGRMWSGDNSDIPKSCQIVIAVLR